MRPAGHDAPSPPPVLSGLRYPPTRLSVYCRNFGVVNRVVLHAVDTSGNRSGPSNEVLFQC